MKKAIIHYQQPNEIIDCFPCNYAAAITMSGKSSTNKRKVTCKKCIKYFSSFLNLEILKIERKINRLSEKKQKLEKELSKFKKL